MLKRFFVPAIIGIIIGVGSVYAQNETIVRVIYTFSDLLLNILLLLGPIVIVTTLTIGISGIKNNWQFYIKFLTIIFVSLFISGVIFYLIIKLLYPHLLVGNLDKLPAMTKAYTLPNPFNTIYQAILNIKKSFTKILPFLTFGSILLGIIFSFIKSGDKILNGFSYVENKIFWFIKKVMLPLMPIWTVSLFSSITYQSTLSGLIINDLWMSFIILGGQLLFLLVMYFITSKYSGVVLSKILNSAKQLFADTLAMMGLGGNLILPYGIKAQTSLGVNEDYAKTITASSFNLPGSFIANIGFAYGIIVIFNIPISNLAFVSYIFFLVLATIIAPALPLGVFTVTQQLLHPILGFNPDQIKLMSTLYYNQGTTNACVNNCGDIYLGLLLNPKKENKTCD